VLVHFVRVAEAVAHLPEFGLGPVRQREQRHVGFREGDRRLLASCFLARLDADNGRGIGIDLTEERELDLTREEPVLLTREGAALGFLDVALGEVADEVAGDADVEQQLAGAALLVLPGDAEIIAAGTAMN